MKSDFSRLERFDWDKGNLGHIKKHRVNFRECEEVFLNRPLVLTRDETHSQIEERFRLFGKSNKGRLLFLIFTVRGSKIRVISARDQNKKEKGEYRKTGGEGK